MLWNKDIPSINARQVATSRHMAECALFTVASVNKLRLYDRLKPTPAFRICSLVKKNRKFTVSGKKIIVRQ
jgi:uncharacterized protein YgiM (DUF1202 family)